MQMTATYVDVDNSKLWWWSNCLHFTDLRRFTAVFKIPHTWSRLCVTLKWDPCLLSHSQPQHQIEVSSITRLGRFTPVKKKKKTCGKMVVSFPFAQWRQTGAIELQLYSFDPRRQMDLSGKNCARERCPVPIWTGGQVVPKPGLDALENKPHVLSLPRIERSSDTLISKAGNRLRLGRAATWVVP